MRIFSNKRRPVHMGPYPTELLARINDTRSVRSSVVPPSVNVGEGQLDQALAPVQGVLEQLLTGVTVEHQAPLPADLRERTNLLKSAAYFFDATLVGICAYRNQWAIVVATESGPEPERDNLASGWIHGSQATFRNLRATQIAMILCNFIRLCGFYARGYSQSSEALLDFAIPELAIRSGVAFETPGDLVNPFIGKALGLAVVVTSLEMLSDRPLDPSAGSAASQGGLTWRLGLSGTRSAMADWFQDRRASHLSRYPMEKIRKVDRATTRVDENEIPQVPLRASFFARGAAGDLGAKAQAQYPNFVMKEPLGFATRNAQGQMIPLQDGPVASQAADMPNTAENAKAIKSLGYFLGTDLIGICEMPKYAWYSHDSEGNEITTRHKYAIVLLIDQGHETMEGASGDDWISGSQSMRGYIRGMEIATVIASHLRPMGFASRAHSNTDGQVLQVPLILKAGLGELSRIGEVVLNPFVGPRFKSAVVTTDLILEPDRHIDFGLQDMCNKCNKCARECPCNAISWGDKVMFNGYEMWKPDVERCTRYRLTNSRGAACGRCMKTCPYNHEGLLAHRFVLDLAIRFPMLRGPIARLDDYVGNGRRNMVKKWWTDLEIVDGKTDTPKSGANARELNPDKTDPGVPIAYYPASVMPDGTNADTQLVDRKAAVDVAGILESPEDAKRRIASGGARPEQYIPIKNLTA